MKKSITTRIRMTKNGKAVHRKIGQCHFRAKRSGTQRLRKQQKATFPRSLALKVISKSGEL